MSVTLIRKLILTGGRAGMTCELAKFKFNNGVLVLRGNEQYVEKTTRYLGRAYAAYPEGSVELQEATQHGECQVRADARGGQPAAVPSTVQPPGGGATTQAAADGGTADDPAPGGTERIPGGDGHEHTGLHGAGRQGVLKQALAALEHGNDEHWLEDGRPRLDVVAKLSGLADLARIELDELNCKRKAPTGG